MAAVIGGIVVAAGAAYAANKQASAANDASKRAGQQATLQHNPYMSDQLNPYIQQILQAQQNRFNSMGGGSGNADPNAGRPPLPNGNMRYDANGNVQVLNKQGQWVKSQYKPGGANTGGKPGGGGGGGGRRQGIPADNASTQAQDLFNQLAQRGMNYTSPYDSAAQNYINNTLGATNFAGSNDYLNSLGQQLTGPQGTSYSQPLDYLNQFIAGGGGTAYPGNHGLPGLPQQSGAPYNDFGGINYQGGSQQTIGGQPNGSGGQLPQFTGQGQSAPDMLGQGNSGSTFDPTASSGPDPYAMSDTGQSLNGVANAPVSGGEMKARWAQNQMIKDSQTKGVLSDRSRYLQSQGMDPATADQVAAQSGAGTAASGGTYISDGNGSFYIGKPIGGWTDTQSPNAPNIPGSPGPNAAGGPFPATAQNPIPDATGGGTFGQQVSKFFDPSRLDPANDPTLAPYIEALKKDAMDQYTQSMAGVNASSEAGGRFGSGMWQHQAALAKGQSDRALDASIAQTYIGSRQQALQDQMAALGMINSRDQAAMSDKTNRYGIDTQAEIARSNAAAGAASAAAQLAYEKQALAQQGTLANRGMNLQAIEDMMRHQQFGMGLQSQLGGQLQAGQLGALGSIPGLASSGLQGLNLAMGGAQGLEGLAGQAAGIRQAQIGASAANANARLAQQQFNWQQQVYGQQLGQQNINDYLRTIQAVGGLGSTNTGPASALGVSTPAYQSPGAAGVMGAIGGFQTGAGIAGMFGPSASSSASYGAPYSASYLNSQNPGLNPQYGYGTNYSNLYG